MTTKKIVIGDILNESWAIVKKNVWVFAATMLGYFIIYSLIYLLFGGIGAATTAIAPGDSSAAMSQALTSMFSVGAILTWLLMTIISAFFYLGFYKMALDSADGKNPDLSSFTSISMKKIINLFLANLIYGIVVYIGLIACIIPGIFLAVRLQLYVFNIIDHDANAFDALSRSWNSTKGNSMDIFLLGLALVLVNFVGLICCGIGLLVTMPITIIAFALIYRLLTGGKVEDVAFETITEDNEPVV